MKTVWQKSRLSLTTFVELVPRLILSSGLVRLLLNAFSVEEDNLGNATTNNERNRIIARVVRNFHCPAIYVAHVSPTGTLLTEEIH